MPERAFDTMSAAETLRDAGFEQDKAKAIVTVVQSVQGDFATKTDLKALEAGIRNEITAARAEAKADNAAVMVALDKVRAQAKDDNTALDAKVTALGAKVTTLNDRVVTLEDKITTAVGAAINAAFLKAVLAGIAIAIASFGAFATIASLTGAF